MRERLAVASSLCALAALIFASDAVIASCRSGLALCCRLIIPSLFPFFLLSNLLNKLGMPQRLGKILSPLGRRLFRVSGSGMTALILGLCGGYPLGAAHIREMLDEDVICPQEAEQLLGFCNNSGPAFLIGAIGGGIFHSVAVGVFLYAVHVLSAVLTGLLLRGKQCCSAPEHPKETIPDFSSAFTESVKQAVVSILNVCGFVVTFTVLVGLLDADGFFSLLTGQLAVGSGAELHWMRAFLMGLLELGSGVGQMQGLSVSPVNLALSAFLVGWGGISVHYQTMAVIAGSGIHGSLHLPGRLISGSIAAVLAYYAAFLL